MMVEPAHPLRANPCSAAGIFPALSGAVSCLHNGVERTCTAYLCKQARRLHQVSTRFRQTSSAPVAGSAVELSTVDSRSESSRTSPINVFIMVGHHVHDRRQFDNPDSPPALAVLVVGGPAAC